VTGRRPSARPARPLPVAVLLAGAALAVWGPAHPVVAQDSTMVGVASTAAADTTGGLSGAALDDQTAKVAAQLRCPVCRGQSVLESTATLSKEIQAEIRQRLAQGQSPDSVKAYFVSRYGEWILLKPPAHGFGLLVYLFPIAILLGGLGVSVWFVRSRRAREPADVVHDTGPANEGAWSEGEGDVPGADLSEDERSWLEGALRDR